MQRQICGLLLLAISVAAVIPRETLLHDTSITGVKFSPDGTMIGYLMPDGNKAKNVFTMRITDRVKRQVTFEDKDVLDYDWTGVDDVIIFKQDNTGDENYSLFKKNISEKAPKLESTAISRKAGVMTLIQGNNKKDRHVLIAMNDMTPEYYNVYKFDLITNQLSLVFQNKRFASQSIFTDNSLNIRLASEQKEDGSVVYYRVSPKANSTILTSDENQWEQYLRMKPDDAPTTGFVGFDETNSNVYWKWGEDTDLGRLIVAPFNNIYQRKVLHTAAQGELQDFLFHPKDNSLLAFAENYHKPELVIYNETVAGDVKFLAARRPADALSIMGMSRNADTWLVTYVSSERPNEIFVYRRKGKTIDLLINLNPKLEGTKLNKQIGFDFKARDGLRIQAYLSLPFNATLKKPANVYKRNKKFAELGMMPTQPQKMVLYVHGGPKGRDVYGFDGQVAALTSRGYAVMQVNFRGSTGFGKKHTVAGNGEWSRKMHTDLLDAVDFAVSKKIANRSEIAIMGGSYGGYATLVGLTFTPDVFACGVDVVGPSNLVTLIDTLPPYWITIRQEFIQMCGGDPATEEGRRELIARSPVYIADRVKKPLIIMAGAQDQRVKYQESEQFVSALKNQSIPVTYILYPDEGHGFRRTPNVLATFGYAEKFLHDCLGGEFQSFKRGQYNESAIVKSDGL